MDLAGATLDGVQTLGLTGTPAALPPGWLLVNGTLVGPGAYLDGLLSTQAADLAGANLAGADLTGVRSVLVTGTPASLPPDWQIIGGYLIGPGADLQESQIQSLDLSGVDLAGANLDEATLANDNMEGANLSGANLQGAWLALDNLSAANLTGTNLTFLQSTNDSGSPQLPPSWQLVGGLLIGPSADLQARELAGLDLSGADLSGADLNGADLTGTSLAGASISGATFALAGWSDTTCPDGTDSDRYIDGCFSAVSSAQPAANPEVTLGTAGHAGWYTSPATVTWYWSDTGPLDLPLCPESNTTTGSGSAPLSATCTDLAGHTVTQTFPVKVDLTRPAVSVTGVRSGAVYAKGKVPKAGCSTTEGVSGVATAAAVRVTTTGSNGVGKFTATCSGAVSVAGTTQAAPVAVSYTVAYGLSGWATPRPGGTIAKSSGRVTAEFRLAGAANGAPILPKIASALGAAHDVEVTLRGPGIKAHTAVCSWVASARVFRCEIAMPPAAEKGGSHSYTLTVSENVGTGFKAVPITGQAHNPEVIHFR